MREARDAYRDAVRRALAGAVVASLGLSKQAASQLIDTLVLRECLERRIDPEQSGH